MCGQWYVGREIPVVEPVGDEVRRWRVMWTPKRLRLLDKNGEWRVLYSDSTNGALFFAYDAREHAEGVCTEIMRRDGDDWYEHPLPAQWWA